MPVNVVKNARDEKDWEKAKAIAKENGQDKNWAYVMGVYKRMHGTEKTAGYVHNLLGKNVIEEGENLFKARESLSKIIEKRDKKIRSFDKNIAKKRSEYIGDAEGRKAVKMGSQFDKKTGKTLEKERDAYIDSHFKDSVAEAESNVSSAENALHLAKKKTLGTRLATGGIGTAGVAAYIKSKSGANSRGNYIEPNYDVNYESPNYMYMTASENNEFMEKYAKVAAKEIVKKIENFVLHPEGKKEVVYLKREKPYTYLDRLKFNGYRDAKAVEEAHYGTPLPKKLAERHDKLSPESKSAINRAHDNLNELDIYEGKAERAKEAVDTREKYGPAGKMSPKEYHDYIKNIAANPLSDEAKSFMKVLGYDGKISKNKGGKFNNQEIKDEAAFKKFMGEIKSGLDSKGNIKADHLTKIRKDFDEATEEMKNVAADRKKESQSMRDYYNETFVNPLTRERHNELAKSIGAWALPAGAVGIGGKAIYDHSKQASELGIGAYYSVMEKQAFELGTNAYYSVMEKQAGVVGSVLKAGWSLGKKAIGGIKSGFTGLANAGSNTYNNVVKAVTNTKAKDQSLGSKIRRGFNVVRHDANFRKTLTAPGVAAPAGLAAGGVAGGAIFGGSSKPKDVTVNNYNNSGNF